MQIKPTISKSAKFDRLAFSTREDYSKYFIENNIVKSDSQIWGNEQFVSIIHRHWHGEGRNGCIFALLSARRAEEKGWKDYVISKNVQQFNDTTKSIIEKQILRSIADPKCQVLSLLFSNITTNPDLVKLIKWLLTINIIKLVDEQRFDNLITIALRIPLNDNGVLSWLMAFGPFSYFPQTRQSPIVEIAIRVKEKPIEIFHRLNNDREAAHLADLPLDYNLEVMEQTWINTLKRTRLILGEEPNHFSAAKTTITLPIEEWEVK